MTYPPTVPSNVKRICLKRLRVHYILQCVILTGLFAPGSGIAHDAAHTHTRSNTETPKHLVLQDNTPFSFPDLKDKTVLLNFIFTSCLDICPVQSAQLVQLQKQLTPTEKINIHFLSVSIDPTHDTPDRLMTYARTHRIALDNWSLVTGPENRIDDLLTSFGAHVVRPPYGAISHSLSMYLIGEDGELWQTYQSADNDRLLQDLRTASAISAAES